MSSRQRGMRIGSLFSGAGGLDLAVEKVFGGRTVWHCEIDPAASKVLAHHWPGVPNLGSVTDVDWSTVEPVDVLCGGFPCQDLSCAGKRAGLADGTRSGLWSEFARAVDILRPGWVVIENVRGILSAKAHRTVEFSEAGVGDGSGGPVLRALGAVLGDLADLGYDAQWTTVAASSVGAPHRRERVFILATPADAACDRHEGRPEPAWVEGGSDACLGGDSAAPPGGEAVELLPTPAASDGAGGKTSRSNDRKGELLLGGIAKAFANGELLPTPTTQDGKNNAGPSQHQRNTLPLNVVATLLDTSDAQGGNGGGQNPERRVGHTRQLVDEVLSDSSRWGKYAPAIARWEAVTRPAPAPTEPNRNGNPRLAPAFAEWMMGWPAGWVTDPEIGINRASQLRIIGNGVVPQQACAALRQLLQVAEVAA